MPVTLASLPHEIVIRIVEYTDALSRAERLARLAQEEEDHIAQHHAHAHLPMPGEEDEMMLDEGGELPAPPPGIGGPGFMQNLFGFLGGGPPPGNAAGQGATNGAAGAANNPFAPVNGGPNAAGGPMFGFDTLMHALGAQPGQGLPPHDESDDEMPALEPLPGTTVPINPTPNANATAPTDTEDDEMPPLEPLTDSSAATSPTATANAASPADEMPPLGNVESATMHAAPVSETAATAGVQATSNVTVSEDSDTEMPQLENLPPASSPSTTNPAAVLTDINTATIPLNVENDQGDASPPPDTATADQTLLSPTQPFTPATPSVTGSLAHELAQNIGSVTFTPQDLEDMPDLQSPTVPMSETPMFTVVSGPGPEEGGDEADWEDEEEDGDDEQEEEVEDEDDEEDEDEEEGEEEDEEEDEEMPPLEGHANWVDPLTYTYKEGLPIDPLLPLAFVNRSFLNAVRGIIYGRAVTIIDIYQASLFLKTLQSPIVSIAETELEADDDEARKRQELAYLVRNLAFDIRKCISLGRGGGSVVIDILNLCPRVEGLALGMDWTKSALGPLQEALKKATQIKTISLRSGEASKQELVWDMKNMEPLLSTWKHLEDLQMSWLKTAPGTFKPLAGTIKKLSLNHVDIKDSDLHYLLKNSQDVLQILEIHLPSDRLTREGLSQALRDNGSNLISLQIDISRSWHPRNPSMPLATFNAMLPEMAAATRYLMDGLIGYMPKLQELKMSGSLASTVLVARLPKSIQVLALEDNLGVDIKRLIGLLKKTRKVRVDPTGASTKTKTVPTVLPKLRCLTYARSDGMRLAGADRNELVRLMDQRKACMHWTYSGRGGPAAVWAAGVGPGGPGEAGFQLMGGMMGDLPFGPDGPLPQDFMEVFGAAGGFGPPPGFM